MDINDSAAMYTQICREEKGGLGKIMGAGPARLILDVIAGDRWDLLAPMLAVVAHPQKRLQAAAHTARLITKSPLRMGNELYKVALQALTDFTVLATPLQEMTVIETCMDILQRNEVIAGEMVTQAIFTHLDGRLQMPRTAAAAKLAMRLRVRQEMRKLFESYVVTHDKTPPLRADLQKVLHGLADCPMVKTLPTRSGLTTVVSLPTRKPV